MNNYTKLLVLSIFISVSIIGCSKDSADNSENENTIAPSFKEELPANITVECDNIPVAQTLSAADVCSGASISMSETITGDNDECPSEYVITRTWTLNNCGSNSISHTQTITVVDNTLPVFNEALPMDETVEFNNIPNAITLTASDNCDTSLSVSFSETIEGDNDATPNDYVITRTWIATDCAGNENAHTQIITVEDNSISYKFIHSIMQLNAPDYNKGTQFIYENERLVFVYLYECSGQSFAYEYNTEGKISKRYMKGGVTNFDRNTFNLSEFKSNATLIQDFVYNNSVLTDIQSEDGFVYYHFSYDSDNKMQVIEHFLPGNAGNGLWAKITLNYDAAGNLNVLNKKEYTIAGALAYNSDYTFEFDNNPNPFLGFNNVFGLYNLEVCTGMDYIGLGDTDLHLFKNNPTKIYYDGNLGFDSTYEYDSQGYPIRMSYAYINSTAPSDILLIEYR